MPAKPSKQIIDFMALHKIDSDEIWCVHNTTWVVKHKALERAAAAAGITWDRPAMIETNSSDGIVAIVVFGKLNDRTEWSIGEASPKNNKNQYPYAMAEKRAKDRVILKLLNADGDQLYSEEEAEDFKRKNPHVTRAEDIVPQADYDDNGEIIDNVPHAEPSKKLRVVDQRPIFEALQGDAWAHVNSSAFVKWMNSKETIDRVRDIKPDWQEMFRGVCKEHLIELRKQERGDNVRMAG